MSEEKILLPAEWRDWEIGPSLGAGSFGTVYEIHRNCYGREEKAALKVIRIPRSREEVQALYEEGYDQESVAARFRDYRQSILDEYNLMASMKGCANIVYCDDVKPIPHDDGMGWDIYIRMELLQPLLAGLPRNVWEPVDDALVIRLGIDLCNALIECRKSGIVHRDIKPQNILRSRDGHYKLGDFGVAKLTEKTAYGTRVGTFRYMAPEVYKCEPYGYSADLYSLGMVMYWLMNGRRGPFLPAYPVPLTPDMDQESLRRRVSGEQLPEPLCGSAGLKRIVRKACAYRPAERYTSVEEMRDALLELQNGRAAGVAAPTQGAVGGGYRIHTEPQKKEPQNKEPQKKEPKKWGILLVIILLCALLVGTVWLVLDSGFIDLSGSNRESHSSHRDDEGEEDEEDNGDEEDIRQDTQSQSPVIPTKPAETEAVLPEATEPIPVETEPQTTSPRELAARIMTRTDGIAAGGLQSIVILSDGTAVAAGSNTYGACDVWEWTDLVAVSSGDYFTVGLRSDGTVVAVGDNAYGQCNVTEWYDIVAVVAGDFHTVGLRQDGTVVATGDNRYGQCDVHSLNARGEIIAVAASWDHTAVLYADGTAAAIGDNGKGECNVSGWRDIVAIYAGANFTVGLKADGTVVATGNNDRGQCAVSGWSDVAILSAGDYHTVAVTNDGRILSTGTNDYGQRNFAGWDNIVAIGAGCYHTVAITADGRILSTGRNKEGQCDIALYHYGE